MGLPADLTLKVSLTAGEHGAGIQMRSSVSRILRSLLAQAECVGFVRIGSKAGVRTLASLATEQIPQKADGIAAVQ